MISVLKYYEVLQVAVGSLRICNLTWVCLCYPFIEVKQLGRCKWKLIKEPQQLDIPSTLSRLWIIVPARPVDFAWCGWNHPPIRLILSMWLIARSVVQPMTRMVTPLGKNSQIRNACYLSISGLNPTGWADPNWRKFIAFPWKISFRQNQALNRINNNRKIKEPPALAVLLLTKGWESLPRLG